MGRPTTAQQQRRQLSRDIIAKQAELGRHPSVLRSKFKQQPAPRVNPQQLELADVSQQLAETQLQLTALQQQQRAAKGEAHRQQLAEKQQRLAALQARALALERCIPVLKLETKQLRQL